MHRFSKKSPARCWTFACWAFSESSTKVQHKSSTFRQKSSIVLDFPSNVLDFVLDFWCWTSEIPAQSPALSTGWFIITFFPFIINFPDSPARTRKIFPFQQNPFKNSITSPGVAKSIVNNMQKSFLLSRCWAVVLKPCGCHCFAQTKLCYETNPPFQKDSFFYHRGPLEIRLKKSFVSKKISLSKIFFLLSPASSENHTKIFLKILKLR